MALNKSISVRFAKADRDRLARVAERSGLSSADLIRFATQSYLKDIETSGKIPVELRDSPRPPYRGSQGG